MRVRVYIHAHTQSVTDKHTPPNTITDLHLQGCNFLLVGGGREKAAHLALQRIVHLYINVEACSLLLVVRVHAVHKQRQNIFL